MGAKKLLVVDDEPDFGSFVRSVGESVGFEVAVISDARDFKNTYQELSPHKIVLDIVMPGIDGIEIIQWLAAVGNQASVVIVSGYAPHYARAAALMAGVDGDFQVVTLNKPVSVADLSAVLKA